MKKLLIVIVAIVVCVLLASDMWARGGRGGWRRGRAVAAVGEHAAVVVAREVAVHRGWRCAPSGGASRGGGGGSRMLLPVRRRCRGRVLRTFKDRVAAKLQIIGHRWVLCPRPASRPGAGAGNRPATGNVANRPSAGTRPSGGNVANRPNAGIGPAQASANRPDAGTRPGAGSGAVAGSRPAAGARPSTRDVQDFLDLPNAGSGNVGGRPAIQRHR